MKYLYYLFLILLIGCSRHEEMSFEEYFEVKPITTKKILIDRIKLDTINFDNINSSFSGQLQIDDSLLYFIDSRFCWVFVFDTNGRLLEKKLGQGRGPNEIPVKSIDAFSFLPDGKKIALGSTSDYYLINENWELDFKNIFDINYNNTVREDPENPATYTFDYENLFLQSDSKGHIFIPIYGESERFNPFSRRYYLEGRILLKVDYRNNKIKEVMGRRSPRYLDYKYLGHHAFFHYDIDNSDNFYISHEIDSLIYVYDHTFRPVKALGFKGKEMDTDYKELSTLDIKQFRNLYFNDRPKRGYYTWVKYFDEKNILFRSYKKNPDTPFDGLQIYRNDTLIADVAVPKNCNVVGYIKPYFYTNARIDEMNEKIKAYRFELKL
ncbi:MAG: hypothetical protein K0B11_18845 [Mariniphaga sp.]|nr:hypothetical protein [Mariniphaga sp.]